MHERVADYFFLNVSATTEIYTLSLHDALPISSTAISWPAMFMFAVPWSTKIASSSRGCVRSEEHTSELQSPYELVCRRLLEKKRCGSTTGGRRAVGSRSNRRFGTASARSRSTI